MGFAGAYLRYTMSVRLRRDVDWSPVRPTLAERYAEEGTGLVLPGRRIELDARGLRLDVSGTTAEMPADDGGLQSALLLLVYDALRDTVASVTTSRWTDTPFEEPPPRRRNGREAVALLERLVCSTFSLRVEALEFFVGGANPELCLVELSTGEDLGSVRRRALPVEIFLRPGRYTLRAEARAYSFPSYHSDLKEHARAPIWISPPMLLRGDPGETVRLYVGVPEERCLLDDSELAFFAQRRARDGNPPGSRTVTEDESMAPPPSARDNVSLRAIE